MSAPVPDLQLAIDISNYQGDLPAATFRGWAGNGARTIICGTDENPRNPLVFVPQVSKTREAGMRAEAYTYLFFGENGHEFDVAARTNRKLDLIDSVGGIPIVWLDCEQEGHGLEAWQIVNGIVYARDAVLARGYQCGIYTRREWWVRCTNDEQGFWNLPWWLAHYSAWAGHPLMSLETPLCGGKTELYRRQYSQDGRLAPYDGDLDLNVEIAPIAPPPPPPTPSLTQDARDAFEQIAIWATLGKDEQRPWQLALEQTRLWGGNVEAAQGGK